MTVVLPFTITSDRLSLIVLIVFLSAPSAPLAAELSIREEGSRWTVSNAYYSITHDFSQGGRIVEVVERSTALRLPVVQADEARSETRTAYYLQFEGTPHVRWRSHPGQYVSRWQELNAPTTLTLEAQSHLNSRDGTAAAKVVYSYTYRSDSPLVELNARLSADSLPEAIDSIQLFRFDLEGRGPFQRAMWIAPSRGGPIVAHDFAWSLRQCGGVLLGGGTAFGAYAPFFKELALKKAEGDADFDSMPSEKGENHLTLFGVEGRADGRNKSWIGEVLSATAWLYVGPESAALPTLLNPPPFTGQPELSNRERGSAMRALREPAVNKNGLAARSVGDYFVLANRWTGLLFRGTDVGAEANLRLDAIWHQGKDHPFLNGLERGRTLWRVAFRGVGGDSWMEVPNTRATMTDCSVRRETQDGKQVGILNVAWKDTRVGDGRMDVFVTVELSEDDPLSRWRIRVEPRVKDHGLWSVDFPVVQGLGPDPSCAKYDYLAVPYKTGLLMPQPARASKWPDGCHLYPGAAGWQFVPYWQGGAGLYFGAHDGDGPNLKIFDGRSTPPNGFELRMTHYPGGMGLAETRFAPNFECVVGTFDGDWYDATQIYRSWLLKQEWFAKEPLAENNHIPRWFKDNSLCLRAFASPQQIMNLHYRLAEFFDMPCLLSWYDWREWRKNNKNKAWWGDLPENQPRKGYADTVQRLQAAGVRVAPYTISNFWDITAPTYQSEQGDQLAVRGEKGNVLYDSYGKMKQAQICEATPGWREKMARIAREIQTFAVVDGIYFDLAGTAAHSFCFSSTHGHPRGGGNAHVHGVRELIRAVRAAGRETNPEFIVKLEGNADCYTSVADTYLLFECDLPIRLALYADYFRPYADKRCAWRDNYDEARIPAELFAWGSPMGRVDAQAVPVDEEGKWDLERAAYYKAVARHRNAALPWLAYGKMLRPVALESVTPPEPDFMARGELAPRGAWRAPDGSVAFVFANGRYSTPVTLRWSAPPQEYGYKTDGSQALWRVTAEGPEGKPRFEKLMDIRRPIQREDRLPPVGTLVLVVR